MEFSPHDIKKFAQLLNINCDNDSSSDDEQPKSSKLGPGDIKPKSKIKIKVPSEEYEHSYYKKKNTDSKAIWEIDEVPVVAFCDDASYDPRPRPEFDIKYRQAVTSEDVFLKLGRKNPSTASCEVMVVSLNLEGDRKEDIDLHLTKHHLDLRSPLYRLSLPLPHPADPEASNAEWEPKSSTLIVSLALSREFDFVNF